MYLLYAFNLRTLFKLETLQPRHYLDIKTISNVTLNFARMKFKFIHYEHHEKREKKQTGKKMKKHNVWNRERMNLKWYWHSVFLISLNKYLAHKAPQLYRLSRLLTVSDINIFSFFTSLLSTIFNFPLTETRLANSKQKFLGRVSTVVTLPFSLFFFFSFSIFL